MKQIILGVFVISSLYSASITTGSKTGTYIKIGNEIKRYVTNPNDISLHVLESKGSIDNIEKLGLNKSVKYAIVQHDVIAKFRGTSNTANRLLSENTKVLLPLYYEEIHFLVKKNSDMKYIKDIKDKRINVGSKKGGTFLTSSVLYKELFSESMYNDTHYDKETALKMLENGKIDVMVIVAGQPTSFLENIDNDKFKLLKKHPYTQNSNYYTTKIDSNSYKFLKEDIETLAVKAYLVTYDDSSKSFENEIRFFAKNFRKSMPTLKKYGHEKWKKVSEDLTQVLPAGWKYYEPFKDAWKYAVCTEDEILMGLCTE